MKKLIYTILLTSSIFVLSSNANDKEVILPKDFSNSKKVITEEACRKYLGEENFKFIEEVFNDKMAPMLKCKDEMR